MNFQGFQELESRGSEHSLSTCHWIDATWPESSSKTLLKLRWDLWKSDRGVWSCFVWNESSTFSHDASLTQFCRVACKLSHYDNKHELTWCSGDKPEASGCYHITHWLFRHVLPSGCLSGQRPSVTARCVHEVTHSWVQGYFTKIRLSGSEIRDHSALQGLWKTIVWRQKLSSQCRAACQEIFHLSLCCKTRKWCCCFRPNPPLHLIRGRGHTELDLSKNKEESTSSKVCVWSLPQIGSWRQIQQEFTLLVGFSTRIWTYWILHMGIWGC